jgi:hypothetical protein
MQHPRKFLLQPSPAQPTMEHICMDVNEREPGMEWA